MEKQFNADDYVKFALITPIEGTWSFTSYTDIDGNNYRAITGYTSTGLPRNFDLKWSSVERIYRARRKQKVQVLVNGQEKQMLLVDYIKGHPCCEGSVNGSPQQAILFKELDPIKDASLEMDRRKRRNEAMSIAFGLEGEELNDMATLIGVFVDDPVFKMNRVSEFANQDPEMFFKLYESGEKGVRALVRKSLTLGKLKKVGDAVFFGEMSIGGNEDQAVSYLIANPEKAKALRDGIGAVPQDNILKKKK